MRRRSRETAQPWDGDGPLSRAATGALILSALILDSVGSLPGLSREARSTDRAGLSLLSLERFTGWSGFDSLVFLRVKWRVIPGVCWEPHRHPAFWGKSAVLLSISGYRPNGPR